MLSINEIANLSKNSIKFIQKVVLSSLLKSYKKRLKISDKKDEFKLSKIGKNRLKRDKKAAKI